MIQFQDLYTYFENKWVYSCGAIVFALFAFHANLSLVCVFDDTLQPSFM